MLIPNSLRQEYMPQMVYVILKQVANGKYSEDEIRKRITASNIWDINKESKDQFTRLFSFCKDAEMIYEKNGSYYTYFSKEELSSLGEFSYTLLGKMVVNKDNKFDMMLKWYLATDSINESSFTDTAEKIAQSMSENKLFNDISKFGKISEDDVHGFLFWMEFFQIAYFEQRRSGHVFFGLENVLMKFIEKHPEMKTMGELTVLDFLNYLSQDLYFIWLCVEEGTHNIRHSLSLALRILENADLISLEYRDDSDQKWHLISSSIFTSGNTFTNVRLK